jgi:signal-transduction protein with cAMP-binding, CBS, and nucleotidyltransferase domain
MFQILKESRLFKECTTKELEEIADLCKTVTIKNGERIFAAKSFAKYLYIVCQGAVELQFEINYLNASQELTLERKTRGEVFGWSALTKPNVYTLTAVAVQNTDLLSLNERDLEELCVKNEHLGYVLMNNIATIIGERFQLVQNMLVNEVQNNFKEKESRM